jgi:uncharacterized protein YbbC (DUF1343 family)
MKKILFVFFFLHLNVAFALSHAIQAGDYQTSLYLSLLKNKKVGLFVNQSAVIGKVQLVDFLHKRGIHIAKIFVPEHGFRGNADDGDTIKNSVDAKTGIPIISLYGKKVKPTAEDLQGVDILVFDIQDVGVRFYTFISSLQRLMEAAVENNKPLIILDRPNPNGFYVDGPVLDLKFKSFMGLQPIPIVHGMTVGEYARMLVGEQWLEVVPRSKAKQLKLTIIKNVNYTHKSLYEPPVKPSPNLPSIQSIYWYPTIGLLEGTIMSVGRGTNKPFQQFGHPRLTMPFTFIPRSRVGAKHPLYENQICHGWDLSGTKEEVLHQIKGKLQIKYLIKVYQSFPDKKLFLPDKSYPNNLFSQISLGMSEQEIRNSWEPKLSEFKKIRKKYLLYPDF